LNYVLERCEAELSSSTSWLCLTLGCPSVGSSGPDTAGSWEFRESASSPTSTPFGSTA